MTAEAPRARTTRRAPAWQRSVRAALCSLAADASAPASGSLRPDLHARLSRWLLDEMASRIAAARGVDVRRPPRPSWLAADRAREIESCVPWTKLGRGGAADVEGLGELHEYLRSLCLERDEATGEVRVSLAPQRRRDGAHYTPQVLAEEMAGRALAPLIEAARQAPDPRSALGGLRICDPAMGAGAFLLAAGRRLREALIEHGGMDPASAALHVATRSLHGVDIDPLATDVARTTLALFAGRAPKDLDLGARLVAGDALTGRWPSCAQLGEGPDALAGAIDWPRAFGGVLDGETGGFDVVIGNPPWVSFAGRAAQPLDDTVRASYARSSAFRGYRNQQGLFVHLGASLLGPGGRLALVLPTSMADLDGYEPVRHAHAALATCDPDLPDFGDGRFAGVYQPCMGLLSTRRAAAMDVEGPCRWPIVQPDLDARAVRIVARFAEAPTLPAACFGERGLRSEKTDRDAIRTCARAPGKAWIRLGTGTEVRSHALAPVRQYADREAFGERLRPTGSWAEVDVLIRQTARFPIAALSDGRAFRNSVLAAFARPPYAAAFLVAWLNSTPIRYLHFHRYRDARQGMPQVKIAQLRATPAPADEALLPHITALGETLSRAPAGPADPRRAELDALVARSLDIDGADLAHMQQWLVGHLDP